MSPALASLRRRWWLALGLGILLLAAAFFWLRATLGLRPAVFWAALAVPTAVFELAVLRRNLPANHAPAEATLFPGLGPANWVTVSRGLLLAVLAGFLLLPRPSGALAWAPALLYTVAIAADLLDGALARLTGRVTALGAALDMEFDGLGVLAASALAVRYGQLPWPYLSAGLARYLFVAGLVWLKQAGRPTAALTPSTIRRIAAGLQMAFISVILWPLFGPPATTVAGVCFAVPFLVGFRAIGWWSAARLIRRRPDTGGLRAGMQRPRAGRRRCCAWAVHCWRVFSWRRPCGARPPGPRIWRWAQRARRWPTAPRCWRSFRPCCWRSAR